MSGHAGNERKRVSGILGQGARGPNILTDSGDLWVLDDAEVDDALFGCRVTAEGTTSGFDRLKVDWIGIA